MQTHATRREAATAAAEATVRQGMTVKLGPLRYVDLARLEPDDERVEPVCGRVRMVIPRTLWDGGYTVTVVVDQGGKLHEGLLSEAEVIR